MIRRIVQAIRNIKRVLAEDAQKSIKQEIVDVFASFLKIKTWCIIAAWSLIIAIVVQLGLLLIRNGELKKDINSVDLVQPVSSDLKPTVPER